MRVLFAQAGAAYSTYQEFRADAEEAWKEIEGAMGGRNGDEEEEVEGHRAKNRALGQQVVEDIMEGLDHASSLAEVLEDVGERFLAAEDAGKSPAVCLRAGLKALAPQAPPDDGDEEEGDPNDCVRAGLRWLVMALAGEGEEADPDEDEAPPPKAKRGRKTRARGKK